MIGMQPVDVVLILACIILAPVAVYVIVIVMLLIADLVTNIWEFLIDSTRRF